MTREAFERLCFGDYCVRAPKPTTWYTRPEQPHLARLELGTFTLANHRDAGAFYVGQRAVHRNGMWYLLDEAADCDDFFRTPEADSPYAHVITHIDLMSGTITSEPA